MRNCPRCKSSHTKKYGTHLNKNGSKRYRRLCNDCGKFFTITNLRKFNKWHQMKSDKVMKLFYETVLFMEKNRMPISRRRVKKEMEHRRHGKVIVNDQTVGVWLDRYFPNIKRVTSRPIRFARLNLGRRKRGCVVGVFKNNDFLPK